MVSYFGKQIREESLNLPVFFSAHTINGRGEDTDVPGLALVIYRLENGEEIREKEVYFPEREVKGHYFYMHDPYESPVQLRAHWFVPENPEDIPRVPIETEDYFLENVVGDYYYDLKSYTPNFASLSESEREIIRRVKAEFAHMFDNAKTSGVPNYTEEYQNQFTNEAFVEMMADAVDKINYVTPPVGGYAVSRPGKPGNLPQDIIGLVTLGTKIEFCEHAYISYIEQPDIYGNLHVNIDDRRAYAEKWALAMGRLQQDYERMLSQWKNSTRDWRGSSIVRGGIYGNSGGGGRGRSQMNVAAQVAATRLIPYYPQFAVRWVTNASYTANGVQ